MLNRRISNRRISKDSGDRCHLLVPMFLSRMGQRSGGGTDLKLHLVPAVGGRGFGLQAEDSSGAEPLARPTAAWRPPPHPRTEVFSRMAPALLKALNSTSGLLLFE